MDAQLFGTPPRLWGQRYRLSRRKAHYRYTPTPVGTTPSLRQACTDVLVHPHACGDNCRGSAPARAAPVHPHACGDNARHVRNHVYGNRYTPTPVGTTNQHTSKRCVFRGTPPRLWGQRRSGRSAQSASAVHPHACGDNACGTERAAAQSGTPPRLWGKLVRRAASCTSSPVHPHACGENAYASPIPIPRDRYTPTPVGKTIRSFIVSCHSLGTPPRLWGKRQARSSKHPCLRYTPTPVGKTANTTASRQSLIGTPPRLWGKRIMATCACRSCAVHPHACGENAVIGLVIGGYSRYTPTPVGKTLVNSEGTALLNGTPPRLWGKRAARRGKFDMRLVHPHACGENRVRVGGEVEPAGTPPRLWGKL